MSRLPRTTRICIVPGCTQPRVRVHKHYYAQKCAQHYAEQVARKLALDSEQARTSCTLAHLWERWRLDLDDREAWLDGQRIVGMKALGDAPAYRVTLEGAAASVVLRAETVVRLGPATRLYAITGGNW